MRHTVKTSVTILATVVLIVTGYWLVTRTARIASIDYELNLGYATDRFGEPSDPSKPDSGDLWRAEQITRDNKVTFWLTAAAMPALLWVIRSAIRRSAERGNVSSSRHVNGPNK